MVERASSKSPNTMNFYSEERERLKYDLAKRFLYLFFPPSPPLFLTIFQHPPGSYPAIDTTPSVT